MYICKYIFISFNVCGFQWGQSPSGFQPTDRKSEFDFVGERVFVLLFWTWKKEPGGPLANSLMTKWSMSGELLHECDFPPHSHCLPLQTSGNPVQTPCFVLLITRDH